MRPQRVLAKPSRKQRAHGVLFRAFCLGRVGAAASIKSCRPDVGSLRASP